MACEDEPDYLIGGGDMNGIRLSDTMGRSWFHPEGRGLRCPGFNSVAIDPRDHNHLLALGNMVWWGDEQRQAAGALRRLALDRLRRDLGPRPADG